MPEAPPRRDAGFFDIVVAVAYVASIGGCVLLFWSGGLEALIGLVVGGAIGSQHRGARLRNAFTGSFVGLWCGTMLGGLLHGLFVELFGG